MAKKKFTQDIADILADDLALLESIEPGAIVRPEVRGRAASAQPAQKAASAPEAEPEPRPEPASATLAQPQPQPAGKASAAIEVPPLGIDMAAAPLEIDALSAPSIPSGEAPDRPTRPEAPLALPPAAPPPSGHVSELETEPASLEPPEAVAAEPMAPAPHDDAASGAEGQSSVPFEGLEPGPHVVPEPVAARQPEVEPPAPPPPLESMAPEPEPEPVAAAEAFTPEPEAVAAVSAGGPSPPGEVFEDVVTVLEITPPEAGGVREAALPGDRSSSPPSPLPARRVAWNHPVARWTAYVLVVSALTLVFLWLMVSLFRIA